MKNTLAIAIFFLLSCGGSKNEQMTKLINEQKALSDSIPILKNQSDSLINAIVDRKADSTTAMRKAVEIGNRQSDMMDRLKAVNFSIDSLSKMK